jgi:hypothetical protein
VNYRVRRCSRPLCSSQGTGGRDPPRRVPGVSRSSDGRSVPFAATAPLQRAQRRRR